MGDRMNEMKGNVKKGVGKVVGDREMHAEGSAEHDSARASRKMKGAGNAVKGTVKEGVGKMTGDESMRGEGMADRAKGKAQRTG